MFNQSALAQSGCCSWHGGESYCDYSTNRWVCNDGTYSPTCTCGSSYYQAPPSCPLNAYYDGTSCKCYAGYTSNGSYCISYQQYCWNTFGYSSTYDYGTGACTCNYGYVMSGGTCVYGDTYCSNNYGYNSEYNSLSKQCECRSGYTWNSSATDCISMDDTCHNQLGLMSTYNSLTNTCDCLAGFVIIGNQCMPMPQVKRIEPQYTPIQEEPTPTPTPTFGYVMPKSGSVDIALSVLTSNSTPLQLGDSGERVTDLQIVLASDKDIYPEGITSGYFGPSTENAVKRFQQEHKLDVTGVVDQKTLYGLKISFGPKIVIPTITPAESPIQSYPVWLFNAIKSFLIKIFG